MLPLLFNMLFMTRRLLLIGVLVGFGNAPLRQIFTYLIFALVSLVYAVKVKPYGDFAMNLMEWVNELAIILCGYH